MVNIDIVLDFVNSLDLRPRSEAFDSPKALGEWFAERGLLEPGARVTTAELEEARRVREAVRDVIAARSELPADIAAASAIVDDAVCRAKLGARFADGEMILEPAAGGVRGAVGRILAEVLAAQADGTWDRVKACRAEDCRWAFLDTTKNGSRAWCTMRSCGNRAKVQAYRERHTH
jgi:predicted RNA-binding Zn ribbon-like protein